MINDNENDVAKIEEEKFRVQPFTSRRSLQQYISNNTLKMIFFKT